MIRFSVLTRTILLKTQWIVESHASIQYPGIGWIVLSLTLGATAMAADPPSARVPAVSELELMERRGDWIVDGTETHEGKRIRLDGSLILNKDARLTLNSCMLEITGDYSREHAVEFKGGHLSTRQCTLGGFINEAGTAIHTVFHLYEGVWDATDTVVQYSYGISFHWKEGHGVLRGTRLVAGPRPDAIILSGQADVTLVDSSFPIGLGLYVNQGGRTTLDLQTAEPVTATFDRTNLLPAVDWRLAMKNTRVKRWFLFVRQIGMQNAAAEITLQHSHDLILSLLGHNLTGQVDLSNDLQAPLKIGNVTIKAADGLGDIAMYAIYLSGDATDVSVTGRSHICELMHRGGRLRIIGPPDDNGLSIGCTTLELSGNARMEIEHVHLGRPSSWKSERGMGEATIAGNAALTGRNITVRDVRFRTQEQGEIQLDEVQQMGSLETAESGGRIVIKKLTTPDTHATRSISPRF